MRRDAKDKADEVVFPPIEDGKPLVQSGPKVIPKTAGQVSHELSFDEINLVVIDSLYP
jgi:hypothetical protein